MKSFELAALGVSHEAAAAELREAKLEVDALKGAVRARSTRVRDGKHSGNVAAHAESALGKAQGAVLSWCRVERKLPGQLCR